MKRLTLLASAAIAATLASGAERRRAHQVRILVRAHRRPRRGHAEALPAVQRVAGQVRGGLHRPGRLRQGRAEHDRRLSRQAASDARPDLRRRHRQLHALWRHLPGLQVRQGFRARRRLEGLFPRHRQLLRHLGRRDVVVPLQLLDRRLLLEQGRLGEDRQDRGARRPGPSSART